MALQQGDVKFIVVGGLACAFNGFIRTTEGVDILVETSPENVTGVITVLSAWGGGIAKDLPAEEFRLEPGAIRIEEDFPLDMFTVLGGKTYGDFIKTAGTSQDGFRYLSPKDLIEVKANTHREKDQIDILALKRLLHETKLGHK